MYGHIEPKKNRTRFLEFCRSLRSLYPPKVRIAIVLDDFSPRPTTKKAMKHDLRATLDAIGSVQDVDSR